MRVFRLMKQHPVQLVVFEPSKYNPLKRTQDSNLKLQSAEELATSVLVSAFISQTEFTNIPCYVIFQTKYEFNRWVFDLQLNNKCCVRKLPAKPTPVQISVHLQQTVSHFGWKLQYNQNTTSVTDTNWNLENNHSVFRLTVSLLDPRGDNTTRIQCTNPVSKQVFFLNFFLIFF